MIGINNCDLSKRLNVEQQICVIVEKVNELVGQYNKLVDNQIELDKHNKETYSAMKLFEGMQLQYLKGIVVQSPNGKRFKISVNDNGEIISSEVNEIVYTK